MSEETQSENQSSIVSFAVVGSNNSVQIKFADGVRIVPSHVVSGLGGAAELEKIANDLQSVTYADFIDGFHKVMTSRQVNEYQAKFIRNHFGEFF